MIKANELRIGNLLHADWDRGRFVAAVEIRETKVIVNDNDWSCLKYDELSPISVTEEWLRKLGLVEDKYYRKNYVIQTGNEYFSVHFQEDNEEYYRGWIVNNDQSDALCHRIAKVEFVHQLQNLFFALTGEELTIKQPA
jgi:hypothetical protein